MPRGVVLFEQSRVVSEAFEARGWDMTSVDLRPATRPGRHWCGDVFDFVRTSEFDRADIVIWHPTCTWVCASGIHWNGRVPGRVLMTEHSLHQIATLRQIIRGKRACMENPVGIIGPRLKWHAVQHVQPYEFGDDTSKATALRLDGLFPLRADPAQRVPGRWVEWPVGSGQMVERWSNQNDAGQDATPERASRWSDRSETHPGIARAMAAQWG